MLAVMTSRGAGAMVANPGAGGPVTTLPSSLRAARSSGSGCASSRDVRVIGRVTLGAFPTYDRRGSGTVARKDRLPGADRERRFQRR